MSERRRLNADDVERGRRMRARRQRTRDVVDVDDAQLELAPRVTGWRFQRTRSGAGSYVPDAAGVDRPPPGYFAPVRRDEGSAASWVLELEASAEERERGAAEMRAWVLERFGSTQTEAKSPGPPPWPVDEGAFALLEAPGYAVALSRRAFGGPLAPLLALRAGDRPRRA